MTPRHTDILKHWMFYSEGDWDREWVCRIHSRYTEMINKLNPACGRRLHHLPISARRLRETNPSALIMLDEKPLEALILLFNLIFVSKTVTSFTYLRLGKDKLCRRPEETHKTHLLQSLHFKLDYFSFKDTTSVLLYSTNICLSVYLSMSRYLLSFMQ